MNLKKYNKNDDQFKNSTANLSAINKAVKSEVNVRNAPGAVKNHLHVNGITRRPISVPTNKPTLKDMVKPKSCITLTKADGKDSHTNIPKAHHSNVGNQSSNVVKKPANANSNKDNKVNNTTTTKTLKTINNKGDDTDCKALHISHLPKSNKKVANVANEKKQNFPIRKANMTTNLKLPRSLAVSNDKPKLNVGRKSMIPKVPENASKSTTQCSVFDRLYKPKSTQHTHSHDVEKLQNDPKYLKKVIQNSALILNKRHTVFENTKPKIVVPVRRSISAVHFKRIGKHEIDNCIHKWSSIGDKLNKQHLKHINEDENVIEDRVVSAVKSERKKVTFRTPLPNFNTPKPEELQLRLKAWLQKRGKSLDSYHHLQCFGIHHLPHKLKFDTKVFDEENKENIAVESDSDDNSYSENMNEEVKSTEEWRTASCVSDSVDFNESQNTTMTCSDVINLDEVLVGALNDLTEILREVS